jgi:hypothetical protein
MPGTVLGDVGAWHRHYLAAKPSHVGVDVDGLSCPYTVLLPMCAKLGHRVPCQILLFFTWSSSFS